MEEPSSVLRTKLVDALNPLKEAVEISLQLKSSGTQQQQQEVNDLWSLFLQEFFGYIKDRSRAAKINLLAGIRFPKF